MSGTMVVTGYVYIEGQPRQHEEYEKLFDDLVDVAKLIENPIYFCQHPIDRCWLFKYLEWAKLTPTHSVGDNPQKNSAGYHIVQHQKLTWLCSAAYEKPEIDTFAWVDAGILSVPGVTLKGIAHAINASVDEKSIVIPGCWERDVAKLVPDSQVNWRFCGGFFVVPRKFLMDFETAFRTETMRHIRETNNLSWEVNTLQRLEENPSIQLPIWWYHADHNASLFANYPRATNAS